MRALLDQSPDAQIFAAGAEWQSIFRPYYVSMTRARQTLAFARYDGSHPLQDVLCDHPSVVFRSPVEVPAPSRALLYRHIRTGFRDVGLGFAGRRSERNWTCRRIASLSPDDPLEALITEQGRWEFLDRAGSVVGRLAGDFKPPAAMRCRSAEVLAVIGWSREVSEPKYRDAIRCDAWEVVVPELVFEPD